MTLIKSLYISDCFGLVRANMDCYLLYREYKTEHSQMIARGAAGNALVNASAAIRELEIEGA